MRILLCLEFMVMCVLQISSSKRNIDTLTPRNPPGFKSPKKLWWAKEILPNYHISGRLTERQIKYAKDAGFKSILSLFEYQFHEIGENEFEIDKFGDEVLLNDLEYRSIIPSLTEMDFYTVLEEDDDWATVEAIDKLTAALDKMPTPVLLFCDRGYTITLSLLLHFAKKSKNNPKFRPQVNSEKIYKMSAAMGLDFTDDDLKQLISDVTGEPLVENPPQPDVILTEWMDYWPVHPVYKNYFTAGQINKGHLPVIEETGFQHVVNMRLGKTHNGKPSQEIVTLINVNDKTPTYAGEGHAARQDDESLKAARLDTKIGKGFMPENIDKGLDYERSNRGEFGDNIGYNEELERKAFEKSQLKYYHMPIESGGIYTPETFGQYKDKLLEIGRTGEPVIIHCASAHRVAYMAVLAAALQYEKDMEWAMKRVRELGFNVGPTKKKDVYYMFQYWLDNDNYNSSDSNIKEEL